MERHRNSPLNRNERLIFCGGRDIDAAAILFVSVCSSLSLLVCESSLLSDAGNTPHYTASNELMIPINELERMWKEEVVDLLEVLAAPQLRLSVAGFPPRQRRLGFEPRSCHMEFVVDKVAPEQVCPEYFGFPSQFSHHRLLHTHHLSSGAGTIG
jgi:hypothetical protein